MRTYRGTNARDVFDGTNRGERVYGYGGDDDLFGGGGDDRLYGGDGKDLLVGDAGDDQVFGGSGSDLLAGEKGDDALNGGSGFDYATYFYSDAGATVDLAAGTAGDGNGGSDTLAAIEGVYGSKFADTLRGDAGTNELFGNQGDDVLIGGGGQDLTVGNAGADRFVFADGDVSDKASTADLIGDFSHGDGDRIDVSGIDANATMAGDQAFTFVGTAAFSGTAGELRVEMVNGQALLMGDVDGDKVADGLICVDLNAALVSADFVL